MPEAARDGMLGDRPKIEEAVVAVCKREGFPATASSYHHEADAIQRHAERLRAKVRSALPKPFQERLDLALPVANSTISLDDLYEDIRAAP